MAIQKIQTRIHPVILALRKNPAFTFAESTFFLDSSAMLCTPSE
ncbi:hypothetical protein HFN_0279 [Helicobacter fennelliae MRY12-0050]|uniref:Uncharacterized protein n=1 Tax=Helicobacter fennelliae MRY12-0050 TaxID=1325130 RepID=T1DVX9_9HELI|nr:hypothetical protein HFN_0279 [Helicobacter fennelliae MRY12-0050]